MKCVILLALFAVACAQFPFRPGFNINSGLHRLIFTEVHQLLTDNEGLSEEDCSAKCDALFDLSGGHDEELTDRLCKEECAHLLGVQQGNPGGFTFPSFGSFGTFPHFFRRTTPSSD